LFEGHASVYLLLGAVAAGFLAVWWDRQQRRFLAGAGVALLLAMGYYLLDRAVETDREQIESRVRAMAASVQHSDLDAVFRHVSDQFRSPGGRDKAEFVSLARQFRRSNQVTEVVVWDFQFPEPVKRHNSTARALFQVKSRGSIHDVLARCDARFDFSPEHGWRLVGFELFDPVKDNERMPFPF
jgi:hypothetical protein